MKIAPRLGWIVSAVAFAVCARVAPSLAFRGSWGFDLDCSRFRVW